MRLKPRSPAVRVRVFVDLDGTLVAGDEHRASAFLLAIRNMKSLGLRITNEQYRRRFFKWSELKEAERLQGYLKTSSESPVSLEEAFLYHLLQDEIYRANRNSHKHFNTLVRLVSPRLSRQQAQLLARAGKVAFEKQKVSNAEKGYLKAAPGAAGFISGVKDLGVEPTILTYGLEHKQLDKLVYAGLAPFFASRREPFLRTTETRLFGRPLRFLPLREKTRFFYASAAKASGAGKDAVKIMVGDKVSSDIKPAKKAGFVTIHVLTGRHNEGYRENPKESPADYTAGDLTEALAIIRRIHEKTAGKGEN